MKRIESSQNQFVKTAVSLKQRKERDRTGLFVAEGLRFVSELPDNWNKRFFIVSDTFSAQNSCNRFESAADVFVVPDLLFQKITDTKSPQGILAVCEQKKHDCDIFLKKPPVRGFYLICEGIQDPGNAGTIIRTADACAADAVFLLDGCVDLYNQKVLRATMGSIFHIPIFQNVTLHQITKPLWKSGCKLYAAHLAGTQFPYTCNLNAASAFLIGNEAQGLSAEVSEQADCLVKIPMPGQAESLNASVAAAVLCYEVVRQRLQGQ